MSLNESVSFNEKQSLCIKMASNLATLRTKANLKQEEMAERLGISRQNISSIENGKHIMKWNTFCMLVMFFAKDSEIKKIMVAMGVITVEVEETLNISS